MLKKLVLVVLAWCVLSASAFAQQALPFTNRPVTKEQYADVVRRCDRKVLNIDCVKAVEAAREKYNLEVRNPTELAEYIEILDEAPCPVGFTSSFARVLKGGKVDLVGYQREFKPGERCLRDTNRGFWFASLLCGNYVTRDDLPIQDTGVKARLDERKGPITETLDRTGRSETDRLSLAPDHGGEGPPDYRRTGWWKRNLKWLVPAGAVAAGVIYCTVPEPRCFKSTSVSTVNVTVQR